MSHRAFVVAVAGVLLSFGAAAAAPDRASHRPVVAPPAQIIFHGPPLAREIRLADPRENHHFMAGLLTLDSLEEHPLARRIAARGLLPLDTAGRAMLHVALIVRVDSALGSLPMERWPIERAQVHARFYLATERDEALWMYANPEDGTAWGPRRLDDEALAILARHGVPVRAD